MGVRTSVDVLNAQQQVFQTRRDLQQARYAYLVNTLRLKSDRKSTRLNSSHIQKSRMPSSA